ncbi:glutathione synthase/RimK-type ligase-like ATP-grasp enzyme [Croceifilum oryzae]|uniref:Glutathione synthase/RimK-type ligase-like ATP-grasp enzyme n=1 Tax=Croceifilum oryzae TaxID=1553429 RepID=A0AAJ1TEG1_9BACL|nr:YheC/YheD family protein [Croceifilum oryzae]MDQ0416969.1 glutathione synthase/RimK-type ligase-like ATP-grasp enzyme [Croceifilum oryzae]
MGYGKVISKIGNYGILRRNSATASHLPETLRFSLETFKQMCQKYDLIYVKPNDSSKGKGVIRVEKLANGQFLVKDRDLKGKATVSDIQAAYKRILARKMKGRTYLVQQGINSVMKSGRAFDIRAHFMRLNGKWTCMGLIGKQAPSLGVVTNGSSGGTTILVPKLLRSKLGYSEQKSVETQNQLEQIAAESVKSISRSFPSWGEFGVDLAITPNGKIWIYEVNITPGSSLFKRLSPTVYKQILTNRKRAK